MLRKMRLNVLSYNIHKGFSPLGTRFSLPNIKQAVHALHADIIFLQEVHGQHHTHAQRIRNWPHESQFEYLADTLWPHYAYGRNAVYDKGHHGNVILSKYPITFHENIDISAHWTEKRGLLHAIIQVEQGIEVHLICIHLGLLESFRKQQINHLCTRIRSHVPQVCPLIVAGDFNDWRQWISPVVQNQLAINDVFILKHQKPALSFPSIYPVLALDRIYARHFKVKSADTLSSKHWTTLSDHLPLYASLTL